MIPVGLGAFPIVLPWLSLAYLLPVKTFPPTVSAGIPRGGTFESQMSQAHLYPSL